MCFFGADKSLPDGRIIATKGEAGYQARTLAPGLYWMMWIWQYSVDMTSFTIIPEGQIGLVLSRDGKEIPTGRILARRVESDNFQDATSFLNNGGQKRASNGVYHYWIVSYQYFFIRNCYCRTNQDF